MVHLSALGTFILSHPLALLLSIASYMVIGMLWYGPLFMKPWAAMTGMDKVDPAAMKKQMLPAMAVSVSTGFIQAVVLGRGLELLDMSSWTYALVIATILWVPFTLMPMATNFAYTMRPFKLLCIDAGYVLVTLWTMSLILFATAL